MNEALGWGEGWGREKGRKKERGVRKELGRSQDTQEEKTTPPRATEDSDHTLLPVSLPDPLYSDPHYLWSLPVHSLWTCEHYLKITIESLPKDCYQRSKLLMNSGRKARLSTDRSLSEDGIFAAVQPRGARQRSLLRQGGEPWANPPLQRNRLQLPPTQEALSLIT